MCSCRCGCEAQVLLVVGPQAGRGEFEDMAIRVLEVNAAPARGPRHFAPKNHAGRPQMREPGVVAVGWIAKAMCSGPAPSCPGTVPRLVSISASVAPRLNNNSTPLCPASNAVSRSVRSIARSSRTLSKKATERVMSSTYNAVSNRPEMVGMSGFRCWFWSTPLCSRVGAKSKWRATIAGSAASEHACSRLVRRWQP